ncbi:TNF receptor-associated factor 5 isoform X1 [Erpetoichthys calabaricus]|uniref:TNF receptor-associated factor n=1 Tax=Erpetoichthys calabaricus TaxID=27687 RepID=A0A8C4XDG5_ERPCA|nr:TNF receptor-associated factor 5 isoform X1 [Erpetoichthys calabaricus]XP_028676131.1 TNF receptor-associated factor 5 isoform X1 [Erpetoichthys calabaricus]
MAANEYSYENMGVISRQNSNAGISCEFEMTLMERNLQFVEKLEDQYTCPSCCRFVINPHQASCGHIFCYQCITMFLECRTNPVCPVDNTVIKANEVFLDNCCKREILNREVFCVNSPNCLFKVILCRLQDHLKQCPYESVQCTNKGCTVALFRKDVKEHIKNECKYRLEPCSYCQTYVMVLQVKTHEQYECLEYLVPCPDKCSEFVKRSKLADHFHECPEIEVDCIYKKYGCTVREKRIKVRAHEDTALKNHLLLVVENNTKLEKQIAGLKETLHEKHNEIQELTRVVDKMEKEIKPLVQNVTRNDNMLSAIQKSLEDQKEKVSNIHLQLQQLSRSFNQDPSRKDLGHLRISVDNLRQQVSVIESLRDRLASLEVQSTRHSGQLNIHVDQLSLNEERFNCLESTSYNGKFIWKIRDYKKKKKEAAEGRIVSIFSQPFYTSRCGYKLGARAYLNGDGNGKGTHLSLYIVLMKGEFDSLLPWPFKQMVTLMILDQSGAKSDISDVFKPDLHSGSFKRPVNEMNVASGFPCFVPHTTLESSKQSIYIKDETLFVKVKVDLNGLEEL